MKREVVAPKSDFSVGERGSGFKHMKKSYWLIGALAVLALSILLPWVSLGMGFVSVSMSGWALSWMIKVLLFVVLGIGAWTYYDVKKGATASFWLSVVLVAYMVFRLIFPPEIGSGFAAVSLSISAIFDYLGFGFYLFVIATITVGILAWKNMKSESY